MIDQSYQSPSISIPSLILAGLLLFQADLTAQTPAVSALSTVKVTTKSDIAGEIIAAKRIVFLGDSNTHAGEYVTQIEAALLTKFGKAPEIINLGLSSETCCGLSEPVHPFPRPTVQERLDRVLEKTKPDFVFACYGMNDGIYHPFDESRFEQYQAGINELITKVNIAGAKLILLTPPPFDRLPMSKQGKLVDKDATEFSWEKIYENYDEQVIGKYADWVSEQKEMVRLVIDTYDPLKQYLADQRKIDPNFTASNDGVHFDNAGHQVFALAVLKAAGFDIPLSTNQSLLDLVRERQSISHLAWLSHVGHLRPGITPGLPMDDAQAKMLPLTEQIQQQLKSESN